MPMDLDPAPLFALSLPPYLLFLHLSSLLLIALTTLLSQNLWHTGNLKVSSCWYL